MKNIFTASLMVGLVSVCATAHAATTLDRKPAYARTKCSSKERAEAVALKEAKGDDYTECEVTSSGVQGPAGQFFTTYHVALTCKGGVKVYYDAETHLVGTPGNLKCTAAVYPAGKFEAHAVE